MTVFSRANLRRLKLAALWGGGREPQLAEQLDALGKELQAGREVQNLLQDQLSSIGTELQAAREREASMHAQLVSVGTELQAARERETSLHAQLTALHRELVATRARETALRAGLETGTSVPNSQRTEGSAGKRSLLFNAIPKSASTYCFETIREALDLQPTSISLGYFSRDMIVWGLLEAFGLGNRIAHHHIDASPENIRFLRQGDVLTIVHVRDPRQVMVSWVHHLSGAGLTWTNHRTLYPVPEAWFAWDFTRKLDWMIDHHLSIFCGWIEGWVDAQDELRECLLFTTFDQLIDDRSEFFARIIAFLGIDPGDFKDRNLDPTAKPEFQFRKGEADEWRGLYSAEQKGRAERIVPNSLLDQFGWKP